MIILTKEQVCRINYLTVENHGGNFMQPNNFLHEENLEYLIEAVNSEMFGISLYPTITDKAGLYMYNIISNHIFSDGNKRTGLEAAIVFLRLNKKNLSPSLPLVELYEFTIKVASAQLSLVEVQAWFLDNVVEEYL